MSYNLNKGLESMKFATKTMRDSLKIISKTANKLDLPKEEKEIFAGLGKTFSDTIKTRNLDNLSDLKNKMEGLKTKYKPKTKLEGKGFGLD